MDLTNPLLNHFTWLGKAKYLLGEWGLKKDFGADNGNIKLVMHLE